VVHELQESNRRITQKDIQIESLKKILQDKDAEILSLKKEIERIHLDLELKDEKISHVLCEQKFFVDRNDRTRHLTGLASYAALNGLFKKIEPEMTTRCRKLSKWQRYILTLIRLRTGCTARDLGYRFDVSDTNAGEIFHSTLNLLYYKLESAVFWPSRSQIIENMPVCFQIEFGNVVTIVLDCFEIHCETPSSLEARQQIHSHYKNHCTVKALIGITPSGLISFISKGYSGHSSDKHIFNNSGITDQLEEGDVVMCDKGFRITDEVHLKNAELILPAFRKGGQQLDAIDLEETRYIAQVRVHVERLIASLRQKYLILSIRLPISMLCSHNKSGPEVDKILRVGFYNIYYV
jgi:hypothetical protein